MNLTKKATRIFALALCLAMAIGVAMPAMAAAVVGYTIISADNTPAYSDTACTTVIGTFKSGDIVAVESQISSAGVWVVRQSESSTAIAYVKKAATSGTVGTKKTSDTVATMTASSGTVTGGDTSGGTSTGGQAGYITNCKSYVSFRSAPNGSSSKSNISKNAVLTVYELTNGYYKVTNSSGQTGYVAKQYVAIGTPPTSSGSSGGTSTASGTGTVSNCKSSVNWRATASTSGKKLGTLKKGTTVQVLGTEGGFYKISYNKKTGYIAKEYLSVSGSTGGSTGGGSSILFNDAKVEPDKSTPNSTLKSGFDAAKRVNKDTIGYMSITGTNIKFPILYRANDPQATYYDSHDVSGNAAAKGAVHSFYGVRTRNNTVTAHNMRGSNDMFHQLSHIYDKAAGQSACQTTDYKCAASSLTSIPDVRSAGSSRQWDIYAFGYTKWEVWAMYKTEANEPTSTINYNISFLSTASKSDITNWISTQKGRSIISGDADASDIFMTLYTCGTNFDHASAQSRIYIFLKAIK